MKKTLYFGGDIVTMEDSLYTEAVLVCNGKIAKIGTLAKLKPEADEMIDLKNTTMLPGFIDSHSHLTAYANTMVIAQLSELTTYEEIQKAIKNFISRKNIKDGDWIMGFGYDQNILPDKQHPTKAILDEISTENPIVIVHASGHMGVVNSKALEVLKIDKSTPDMQGGKIGKDKDGNLTGYLEERAFTSLAAKMPQPTLREMIENVKTAEKEYFKYGVTTIQDGLTTDKEWFLLKKMAEENLFKADVVCYADLKNSRNLMEDEKYKNKYSNRLKLGGYKIFLDGSPQGRTAWMENDYENEKGYKAYGIYNDDEVLEFVTTALKEKQQLLTHCNGDAAARQLIEVFEAVDKQYGFTDNFRPVMIHSQLTTPKQMKKMAKLNMIASFFIAHTYYWGDVHLKNFGERAMRISCAKSAQENGVVTTFHQDSPVLPPDMLMSVWCACARVTKDGVQLDKNEKVSVLQALKSVTINAAYQYFEENLKGTITEGKTADFVILDKNPLKCTLDEIKQISVLKTIKNGEIVYSKDFN